MSDEHRLNALAKIPENVLAALRRFQSHDYHHSGYGAIEREADDKEQDAFVIADYFADLLIPPKDTPDVLRTT